MVRSGTQSAPAVLLMAATITVLGIGTAHAASPANQCESAKNKIAGKYAFCREEAEAKAIKTGAAADYTKCDATFGQKWAKTEAKGAGMCPTNGDQAALQRLITADTNQWATALGVGPACSGGGGGGGLLKTGQTQCDQGDGTLGACPGSPAGQDGAVMAGKARCYTDNGDGTITDNVTGLMWERQSADGSIHSIVNIYTWYDAFNVKIAALNSGGGFAGHTDWRLPNLTELRSLADYGREGPAIDPVFNTGCTPGCALTACSCTFDGFHWSSTTRIGGTASPQAWLVDFVEGAQSVLDKSPDTFVVRAVRGGS